jgi:glycosyltransferase involved in cell wall biosynthesis
MKQPRVLLSAYQCAPGGGSVSEIGWQWYSRLAARLPVTLVTHARNAEALRAAGAPLPGSRVEIIDTEWFAGPLYRLACRLFPQSEHSVFFVSSLDFFVYEQAALRRLRRDGASRKRWDVVHVPTPVSLAACTRLHRLGVPLIRGPLNSGLGSAAGFPDTMREEVGRLDALRRLRGALDALLGSTRNASTILAATATTRDEIATRHQSRCLAMLENGVDLDRFPAAPWPEPPSGEVPLRVLFVGRLVPSKALPLLLGALARVRHAFPVEARILGDGPMSDAWRREAQALGLTDVVTFEGAQPFPAVAAAMRWAHALCLPSVRESGGGVLLEAMSTGRPVVAVNFGGPAELVDDAVGRLVPADGPDAVTAGFAAALRDMVQSPEAWRRRGQTGRQRAETRYAWDAKVDAAVRLYEGLAA